MTTIIQTQQVRNNLPDLPNDVFILKVMPYVGDKMDIIKILYQLSKKRFKRFKDYSEVLSTIKWSSTTWKEAVCGGVVCKGFWDNDLYK